MTLTARPLPPLAAVLALLLPCSAAGAQTQVCHADFDTPQFDPLISMGGPNLLLAIQTTAPMAYGANRIEMFTGNGTGVNSVAIWGNDPVGNLPLAPVATGTWSMSAVPGWQGANLFPPVALNAGDVFWVVWGCINGSLGSTEGNGAGAQPYRGSFNGGATWNGPFQSRRWKFRIFCGGLSGQYEQFGTASCRGSSGTPRLGWDGIPNLGTSLEVRLRGASSGALAILGIGLSDTLWLGSALPAPLQPFGGGTCTVLAAVDGSIVAVADPSGAASAIIALPAAGSLVGLSFFDQWWVADAATALGLVTSDGGRGTIGI